MHPISKIPKEHVQIRGWSDMPKIGIELLTGERDGTMTRRMLCDLSRTGSEIVARFLDIKSHGAILPFNLNWNQRVGNEKAIYSVMLHADWWKDIAVFGLIVTGSPYVYANSEMVWTDDGEDWNRIEEAWSKAYADNKTDDGSPDFPKIQSAIPGYMVGVSKWKGQSIATINNAHQMSGRP